MNIAKKIFFFSLTTALSASLSAQVIAPAPAIPEAQPPSAESVEVSIPDALPPTPIGIASTPSVSPPVAPAPVVPVVTIPAAANPTTTPAAPAQGLGSAYGMSFKEAWQYGGWVMWILLAVSVFALSLVIYFLCTFRTAIVAPRRLVSSVRDAILEGDDNNARRLCDDRPCAFSSLSLTALDCVRAIDNEKNDSLLRDLVQSEGVRITDSMQSQTQLLLDLAAIAPMLGLLGTTLGMLQAFGSIAQDVMVAAKPVILAQGVSKAIITTIAGLMVAIPCMAAYALFRRRVSRLTALLENAAAEIITAIAARKGASKE